MSSRTAVASAVSAAATLGIAPVVVAVGAVRAARRADAAPTPTRATSPRVQSRRAPAPHQVAIFGFLHQDVVFDVWTGATGTVLHSRVIDASGGAAVRWHRSFAQTPLADVAGRLALVNRRW